MKKNIFSFILWIVVIGLMCSVFTLPDIIPIHFDINGNVDQYGHRYFLFIIHLLPLAVYYGMELTKNIDPLKHNIVKKQEVYELYKRGLSLFFVVLSIYLTYISKIQNANNIQFICLLLGILLIGMGNYMPKIPQNHYLGIKTQWTLKNEYIWKKTHRLGGIILVVVGLLYVICAYIHMKYMLYYLTGGLIGACLFVSYYSYYLSKKEEC